MTRPLALILCALVVALVLASGCSGCRRAPLVRLTYEVDVAGDYDGEKDADRVVSQTRDAILQRLEAVAGKRSGSVSVNGHDVVVEAALDPGALELAKSVLARSGRLEFDLVDDAASEGVFGALKDEALPAGEGIALYEEGAPAGLDAAGRRRTVTARYARMACRPASHAQESTADCLGRLRSWASYRPGGFGGASIAGGAPYAGATVGPASAAAGAVTAESTAGIGAPASAGIGGGP